MLQRPQRQKILESDMSIFILFQFQYELQSYINSTATDKDDAANGGGDEADEADDSGDDDGGEAEGPGPDEAGEDSEEEEPPPENSARPGSMQVLLCPEVSQLACH